MGKNSRPEVRSFLNFEPEILSFESARSRRSHVSQAMVSGTGELSPAFSRKNEQAVRQSADGLPDSSDYGAD